MTSAQHDEADPLEADPAVSRPPRFGVSGASRPGPTPPPSGRAAPGWRSTRAPPGHPLMRGRVRSTGQARVLACASTGQCGRTGARVCTLGVAREDAARGVGPRAAGCFRADAPGLRGRAGRAGVRATPARSPPAPPRSCRRRRVVVDSAGYASATHAALGASSSVTRGSFVVRVEHRRRSRRRRRSPRSARRSRAARECDRRGTCARRRRGGSTRSTYHSPIAKNATAGSMRRVVSSSRPGRPVVDLDALAARGRVADGFEVRRLPDLHRDLGQIERVLRASRARSPAGLRDRCPAPRAGRGPAARSARPSAGVRRSGRRELIGEADRHELAVVDRRRGSRPANTAARRSSARARGLRRAARRSCRTASRSRPSPRRDARRSTARSRGSAGPRRRRPGTSAAHALPAAAGRDGLEPLDHLGAHVGRFEDLRVLEEPEHEAAERGAVGDRHLDDRVARAVGVGSTRRFGAERAEHAVDVVGVDREPHRHRRARRRAARPRSSMWSSARKSAGTSNASGSPTSTSPSMRSARNARTASRTRSKPDHVPVAALRRQAPRLERSRLAAVRERHDRAVPERLEQRRERGRDRQRRDRRRPCGRRRRRASSARP